MVKSATEIDESPFKVTICNYLHIIIQVIVEIGFNNLRKMSNIAQVAGRILISV
jgi:hypothetical protein